MFHYYLENLSQPDSTKYILETLIYTKVIIDYGTTCEEFQLHPGDTIRWDNNVIITTKIDNLDHYKSTVNQKYLIIKCQGNYLKKVLYKIPNNTILAPSSMYEVK